MSTSLTGTVVTETREPCPGCPICWASQGYARKEQDRQRAALPPATRDEILAARIEAHRHPDA